MPSKTISVTNGDGSTRTITIPDRSRFAGVRAIDRTPPFTNITLRLQITVSGHADMSGVYERTSTSSNQYDQVGGNGNLHISETAGGTDDYIAWTLVDTSDNNPSTVVSVNGVTNTLPWQGLSEFAASGITIAPVTDTLTVDRTAPVITSDRKGESRPLLSKLVGGAAAAYSLRDLNDKAGNNKVVEVRRSSDDADRIFLAKEVSNGTLEAWVGAGNDGFVSKWYDQSGENFHMLQAESTKQPKIVEAGNFLDSVKYDGVDDFLTSGSTAETMLNVHNQALSLFSVQTRVTANESTLGATNSGRGISFEGNVTRVFITQNLHLVNHPTDGSGFLLGSAIHTGDGSSDQIKTARNGVNIEESSQGSNDIISDGQPIFTTKYNTLGGNRVLTTNSNFFSGEIKEVVIWKTNQLANRPAIEANINNQYDIY